MQMTPEIAAKVAGYTPLEAQVEVQKVWKDPVFHPVTGEKLGERDMVAYKLTSESSNGGVVIHARMDEIMDVGHNDDPGHTPTNILKARRAAITSQIARMRDGNGSALDDGHVPLEQWGALSKDIIEYLNAAHNIRSVQQLRDCTEGVLNRMPAGINPHKLRENARAYLDAMASNTANASLAKFEERLNEKDAQIDKLSALLEQALSKLEGDEAPKRRGRPPNEQAAA